MLPFKALGVTDTNIHVFDKFLSESNFEIVGDGLCHALRVPGMEGCTPFFSSAVDKEEYELQISAITDALNSIENETGGDTYAIDGKAVSNERFANSLYISGLRAKDSFLNAYKAERQKEFEAAFEKSPEWMKNLAKQAAAHNEGYNDYHYDG